VPQPFAQRVRSAQVVVGSFLMELPARASVESYALTGHDFVILDLEHSAVDFAMLSWMVAVCRSLEIGCVVRVMAGERNALTRILDMQPDGVLVPGVSTASECVALAALTRYGPTGRRGLAPIVRHRVTRWVEPEPLLIVQVEGREAVREAAGMARVAGVDGVFVGPYDLSQSLGHPGELTHPVVLDAGREVSASVSGHAALGVYVETADQAAWWADLGASVLAVGTDGVLFARACESSITSVRSSLHAAVGRGRHVGG
jgi:4-hydroxy-2-oxoheptanedioate aldolase